MPHAEHSILRTHPPRNAPTGFLGGSDEVAAFLMDAELEKLCAETRARLAATERSEGRAELRANIIQNV